ncbi:MAG TPA: FkbM family methyltransferase [Solirubrobacteraceae bacterium]|jgi:FkbM family methyltransferase
MPTSAPSLPSLRALGRRASALRRRRRRPALVSRLGLSPRDDLLRLGSDYGGWVIASSLLSEESVCVLAGTGEDISFDLALIARFGCRVYALDPVPQAQEYVAEAAKYEPRHHFLPVGLWSEDTTLRFHAPDDPSYVSHSAINLKGTDATLEAQVRSVDSLMKELGVDRLDLLKVSAEGSEYEILEHVGGDGLDVRMLCVEYAQPTTIERVEESARRLIGAGYTLVAAWGWKFTFVRTARPADA